MPSPLPSPAEVQALIDRAKSEGRHSDTFQTVCVGCYRWVGSIHHTTLEGKRVCKRCAVDAGCGCAACEAVREARMARLGVSR